MTTISIILDLLLVAIAAAMVFVGKYCITKQVAAVPIGIALLDLYFLPQIDPSLTMAISVIAMLLQAVILLGAAAVLHEDRVRTRNKMRRRQRRREVAARRAALTCVQKPRTADRVCA